MEADSKLISSNGKGTAELTVYALDCSIYKTEQMINLVQWMHDYNATASDDEKTSDEAIV
ncbi:hypothetical protein [Bacillus sp. JJ1562]|uniref:hypothetical protein n=1 Tax=Bacillus sp. JJ1562 TaxID=3122960 RepID=UPI0030014DA4